MHIFFSLCVGCNMCMHTHSIEGGYKYIEGGYKSYTIFEVSCRSKTHHPSKLPVTVWADR